jgi:hypothetical protein
MRNNDPKIMLSRFASKCGKCDCVIKKNTEIVYYPLTKKVFCMSCGEKDYNNFLSSVQDENIYNGGY